MERAAAGATCGTPTVGTDVGAGAVGIDGAMVIVGVAVGAAAIGDVGAVVSVGAVHTVVVFFGALVAGVVSGPAVPSAWTLPRAGVPPASSVVVSDAIITRLRVFQS